MSPLSKKARRPASDGERSEGQKLKHENRELRRELSRLRKQLDRVQPERYENLKAIAEQQAKEDHEYTLKRKSKALRERWACWECGKDSLRIIIVPKPNGEFYFRRCPNCGHRTKLQQYHKDVKGLMTGDEE